MVSLSSRGDTSPSASEKRKWCDYESVMDINVPDANDPPLKPPVPRYLEEVLLGLQGGEADSRAQAEIRCGVDNPLAEKVTKLRTLLAGEKSLAVPVCSALFWISIGIVFGRMQNVILREFRSQLAQAWYLLCLKIQTYMGKDHDARDWALAALPFVFAQAVYRLLCDAFEDDRKHLVGEGEKLLDKLSLLMHFEVTGFQVNTDTVKKARKKIFLKNVLNKPQVDLFASEEAKKRQEMLESQAAATQDKPLSFGQTDGQGLEETQLEHVMQGRLDRANKVPSPPGSAPNTPKVPPSTKSTTSMKTQRSSLWASESDSGADSPLRLWTPNEDLSVERYDELAGNGLAMWGRHLAEFAKILGQEEAVEQSRPTSPVDEEIVDEPSSPISNSGWTSPSGTNRQSLARTLTLPQRSPMGSLKKATVAGEPFRFSTPLVRTSQGTDTIAEDMTPRSNMEDNDVTIQLPSNRKLLRKMVRQVTQASIWMMNTETEKERKEMIAKQKRIRQEAVQRQISTEPLPQEICEHELVTTWVSPVMKCLASEEDRWSVLRKTRAESRQCKMQVQSLSMPSLRPCKEEGVGSACVSPSGSRASTAPTRGASRGRSVADDSTLGSGRNSRPASRATKTAHELDVLTSPVRPRFDSEIGGRGTRIDSDINAFVRSRFETEPVRTRFASEMSWMDQGSLLHNWPAGTEVRAVGGSLEMLLPGKAIPRNLSAGSTTGSKQGTASKPLSSLTLEPPTSLNKVVVVDRLEKQGSAFRQSTFAEYLKENDIFTGDPKVRFDAVRLRTEEDAALRKADSLVGGQAKRRARTQLKPMQR